MSVAAKYVDYRRGDSAEKRCSTGGFVTVVTAVPGFRPVTTYWTPAEYDRLDLDAIAAALPEGTRISSTAGE